MCFFDDQRDEVRCVQVEHREIEQEYLKLRVQLRDAEMALRQNAANQEWADQVKNLTERLQAIEKQAPWLLADVPQEVALWGQPFG